MSVSSDVLGAIAAALRLTDDERLTLFDIAQPTRSRRRPVARQQRVRHSVAGLLDRSPEFAR
jgi:hypothetical protein